jgi:hypothetical protein
MVVMPAVAIFIDTALNNFKLPQSVFYALLCVLIPTLLIYIWTLIVRIAAHLWALI